MTAKLKVTGFKALDDAMKKLPPKVEKKVARPVMRDSVKEVTLPAAKRIVRSESFVTGTLYKSLRVRTAKGRGGKRLPRGTVGYAVVNATTKRIDGFYGKWVFADRRLRDGRIRRGTRALRRALYDNQQKLGRSILTKGRPALDKAVAEQYRQSKGKG